MNRDSAMNRAFNNGTPVRVDRDRGLVHPAIDDLLGDELSWLTNEAVCRQIDADLWHPEGGRGSAIVKRLCQSCPLIDACLEHALTHGERFGIWGGRSERERRKILAARRAA